MALMGNLKAANLRRMASEFNSLSRLALAAIDARVIPGLVIAIGQAGQVRFLTAFGNRQIEPEPQAAKEDTVYDLASLTKALVTSLLVMRGVGDGLLHLDRPLGDHLSMLADRPAVTLRRTLAHAGGFPAHRKFYEGILDASGPRDDNRAAIVRRAAAEPAVHEPGSRSLYSDLGFILLGELLESSMGARLDVLASKLLFEPLQLFSTGFVDLLAGAKQAQFHDRDIAPTERCPVRGRLVLGEVHDLNAYAMGGVAGHAGLFGNANDLLRLSFALCATYRGASIAGKAPFVSSDVLRLFWQPAGIPGSTWRLGWDGPAAAGSLAGSLLSRRAVGHLSFTGCSLWIDPEQETCVIVLCNRIHPEARDDGRFRTLRPALNDAALAAIGYQAR